MKPTLVFENLMRQPGDGIPVFSAGVGAAFDLQKQIYFHSGQRVNSEKDVRVAWKKSWQRLKKAEVILIGVPTDTGAGIRRGAAYGPREIRKYLLKQSQYKKWLGTGAVVDLGDIYVNPHLLHDEMLSDQQKKKCREAMYPSAPKGLRKKWPVSVLSQLEFVVDLLLREYKGKKIMMIGGDHSIAWPMAKALHGIYGKKMGILQPDAHTDLLAARLGVDYCFGTWSFHAARLLGKNKLVQIGIRQTAREKSHWEKTAGVRQFWANEVRNDSPGKVIKKIAQHFRDQGVKQIYFSNDVDGTDESEISATGTPAYQGLSSKFILRMIQELGREFEWVAADLVEVAPDLGSSEKEKRNTLKLSSQYVVESIRAMLKCGTP